MENKRPGTKKNKIKTIELLNWLIRGFLILAIGSWIILEGVFKFNRGSTIIVYQYLVFLTALAMGVILVKRKHFPILFNNDFLKGRAAYLLGWGMIIVNALFIGLTTKSLLSLLGNLN